MRRGACCVGWPFSRTTWRRLASAHPVNTQVLPTTSRHSWRAWRACRYTCRRWYRDVQPLWADKPEGGGRAATLQQRTSVRAGLRRSHSVFLSDASSI